VVAVSFEITGTARVPIATLVMVAEMTGSYGLIVPSMLATIIAFVVQRAVGSQFHYPRLYEAQVELRTDSPTHHEGILRAAFSVLERGPLVDLRNVTLPHLASLLRHGTPIPIHGGQGKLLTVNISKHSALANQQIADIFERFPDLLAVAIIRDQEVQLPHGSTQLEGGDQLLIVTSGTRNVEAFERLASDSVR